MNNISFPNPRPTVTVTILDTANCDCVIPGERITFNYPEIVKRKSDRLCLRFLHALMPVIDSSLHLLADVGGYSSSRTIRCSGEDCEIKVNIDINTGSRETTKIYRNHDTERIRLELLGMEMFKRVDPDAVYMLAEKCNLEKFGDGEKIVCKGETGKNLYIVLYGAAEVMVEEQEGTSHTVAVLNRGESIGEMSILTREPISATVLASGQCTLAVLSRMDFIGILTRYPSLNLYYSKLLADRLRNSNHKLVTQFEQGVTGKLSTIALPDVTQIIKANAHTGILKLNSGSRKGSMTFYNGVLYDASYKNLRGEDAFFELIHWCRGGFVFENQKIDSPRNIETDLVALILEAMRRHDESNK